MKGKNRLRTNTVRTIKKYFPRFLSLVIMSFLGILVYVGLCSTSPDMLNTLDKFFDDNDTYDIKIVSSMGLDDNDILFLKNIDNINLVEGIYSKDVLINKDDNEYVLKVSSLTKDINKLILIDGRLPLSSNEIVVEENFLNKLDYEINDTIFIDDDTFVNKEVVIVGSVRSTLYFNNTKINQTRGSTTIGTGTVNYYSYVLDSNFDMDCYTDIYLTVKKAKDEVTSKKGYVELVTDVLDLLDGIKSEREDFRYNTIFNDFSEQLRSNEEEVNKELSLAKSKLDKAKNELNKAKKQLDDTKVQLSNAKKELDNAKKQISNGKSQLQNILKQYNITNIDSSLNTINTNINKIEVLIKKLDKNSIEYKNYNQQLIELKEQRDVLNNLKKQRDDLNNSENTYNINYANYQSSYSKYSKGLTEYNNNLSLYNSNNKEYLNNRRKALDEIEEKKKELNKLERPSWYIYSRDDDQTYASYINQTKSIKNLAGVFPLVFYAVAILVSLISMNRMVEDDRGEIGTLKSLGFTNNEIKKKYIYFSLLATLLGAIIGVILGLTTIPYIIFNIYKLLFDVINFQFGFNIVSIFIGVIIAIGCICGASIITANRILKEKPSELMRPKAPKSGKKVLLEKIPWLWHRIKFSNKIIIRNLLRYKKRVMITIIGICGCTALMLCGFGIKDSIVDITNMQYVNTFIYDATVYVNNMNRDEIDNILDNDKIVDYTLSEIITGTLKESNISMIVTSNKELDNIVNLIDRDTNDKLSLEDNEVIITDKIADIYDINVGDNVTILDNNKKEYRFKVTHIVKNYLGHYLYVDKDVLESSGGEYKPNVIYLKTEELEEDKKDELSNELLSNDKVINVVHTSILVDSAHDMLNSLNKVVVILVLLSAMLSFVVLYNLANINITERKREISTLKVLGFYDKEVDNYVNKEMIILTIIGIILGLGFGYLLTNVVISTVEMETARFIRHIKLNSYIYASLISGIFTIIVNFVTHYNLKKIDMIESLKSVE